MKNFLWKCIKSMVFCVGISYTVNANSSEIIQVQAEGSGTSKLEATKNAWQEAVRQAVGVYMSSKTVVLDDDITESIAAYSRGQVDSYKVVKSEKNTDGWHIVILANIEKDVLQEETQKISIKKQTFEFDGTNNVAQKITKEEKQKSAEDVISSIERLDFKDSIVYTSELREDKDKKIYYVRHYIGLDVKKVLNKLSELRKILDKVAPSKKKFYFKTKTINMNKIAADSEFMLKKLKLEKSEPNNVNTVHKFKDFGGSGMIPFRGLTDESGFSDSDFNRETRESRLNECAIVIDSLTQLSLYCFNSRIDETFKNKLPPNRLKIVFKIEDKDGVPLAVTDAYELRLWNRFPDSRFLEDRSSKFHVAFYPYLSIETGESYNRGDESYMYFVDQQLNLSDEEMLNIKNIQASFEIIDEIQE